MKGEALSDGNLMAKYASIVMQCAKNVGPSYDVLILAQCQILTSLQDDKVDAALWRVRCFHGPPTDLFHPSIIAKVTLFWLRQQFGL